MFVILNTESYPHGQVLALNLDAADQIAIRPLGGQFTLVFEKVAGGGTETIMAHFETHAQAIDCFVEMMVALQRGDHVWTLSNQNSTITCTTKDKRLEFSKSICVPVEE